jgi:hypothetical protein
VKKAVIWSSAERNKDATNRSFIEVRQSGRHHSFFGEKDEEPRIEGASQDCGWKAPCDNSFWLVPSRMVLIEGHQNC